MPVAGQQLASTMGEPRTLEIVIRDLGVQSADDYLLFFDEVYNSDPWLNTKNNPWWGICYCGFYDDTRTEEERNSAPDAANKNRTMRAETIMSGKASGLLAYVDRRVVGWCNTGSRAGYRNLRGLVPDLDDAKVGSILCFVVAAPYRSMGVGTALLKEACDRLSKNGFAIAEGYPRTLASNVNNPYNTPPEHLIYRGALSSFLKAGFTVHRQLERYAIVRKKL